LSEFRLVNPGCLSLARAAATIHGILFAVWVEKPGKCIAGASACHCIIAAQSFANALLVHALLTSLKTVS
jgi:hypothetical protein